MASTSKVAVIVRLKPLEAGRPCCHVRRDEGPLNQNAPPAGHSLAVGAKATLRTKKPALIVPMPGGDGGSGGSGEQRTFEMDEVLGDDCSQQACFEASALPLVHALVDGYNGTVFAYGQTGMSRGSKATKNREGGGT